ncbi:cupin domain-containing protein [Paraburkholderia haematera]|uniref:(S)-ureidoglycine aminohydrolase cupin domain-containing protein n=1 Tax=Paraburkholderia haematera TaxID=2793077 RepID=A0ABM8SAT4_9BURK|nr:cupin domain-containing protein [Paraburkholderia haematera]CAE6798580.1 hypothetical protein R69888_05096 [Paraburkholderia haematera]
MADISNIVEFSKEEGELIQYRVPRGKLLSGNPMQTLTHRFISPCGRFSCGTWESTAGHWEVEYDEEEYCEILSGTSVVRDRAGREKVFRAGDRFVIPCGFSGTWEVVESCRKIYVSHAPRADVSLESIASDDNAQ